MRNQLFIRLSHDAANSSWMRKDSDGSTSSVFRGPLQEAASMSANAQVIVIIPGEDVLMASVNMPTQNRQRILKAIPFALEDQLVQDIDELHFAIGGRDDRGLATVVAAKQLIETWQHELREAGISVDQMIPDVLCLPAIASSWTALWEDDRVLLRQSMGEAVVVDADIFADFIPLLIDQAQERSPERILLYDAENKSAEKARFPVADEVLVETESCADGLLGLIASKGLPEKQTINILQGDFSRKEQVSKLWRPWRLAASLAALWFVLEVGLMASANKQLDAEYNSLKSQVEQVYRTAFPDAKKVVNAKVQMTRKLEELRGNGAEEKELLMLLSQSGSALNNTSGLFLRSVRYKNGVVDLEVEVPSLQVLDQLKQRLSSNKKMDVEIQSAAAKENKVQGRLQIKGAES